MVRACVRACACVCVFLDVHSATSYPSRLIASSLSSPPLHQTSEEHLPSLGALLGETLRVALASILLDLSQVRAYSRAVESVREGGSAVALALALSLSLCVCRASSIHSFTVDGSNYPIIALPYQTNSRCPFST